MSKVEDLFRNEKLLEKVATAETKDGARKVCKDEGLEVTDADLDAVAGGLKTVHKVLIGVGATAGAVAGAYGIKKLGDKKGWWGDKPSLKELNEKHKTYNVMPPDNLAGVVGKKMPQEDDEPQVQPNKHGNN